MLDPDISTAAALEQLSRSTVDDAVSLDRRRFLQLIGMGLGAGALAGPGTSVLDSLVGHDPSAWAAGPIGADDGIVLLVGMYGGNDGLNTVVPVNDGIYRDHHGALAVPANQTLRLDANTGLHPELTNLKQFWDADQLAIVEGVGHGLDDFSHFSSMAKWMSGISGGATSSGWIGRWLDGYLNGSKDLFAAAEIGYSLPLHMIGRSSVATTVPPTAPNFGVPREWRAEADEVLFSTIRSISAGLDPSDWAGRIARTQVDQLDLAQTLAPVIPSERPGGETEIVGKLEVAARLINANLGFRVVTAGFGDFDSHAGQPNQHPVRMRELNDAIGRFFATLDPRWAGRVTVMTFSEFGRTSHANDGAGTDHGSSAPQFVMGAGVRGGFYGQRPSLAGLRRWERMPTHVDFRDYYTSVIDGWLGGGSSDVLGGGRENLGLFRAAPATGGSTPVVVEQPAGAWDFVAVTPERIYDTRNGLGGRSTRLGPGETIRVKVAGEGPVPASGAGAVAVNITAVRPVGKTFLTAYPTGQPFPDSSTLNPRAGIVTPNSTIVGIGDDGTISIFNNASNPDVLVDVMGYFAPAGTVATGGKLEAIAPKRLLDTRNGNGAPAGRARGNGAMSLQVTGREGIPASGVTAVVVNLLAIGPDSNGWVVGWPTGEEMPVVSNVQYQTSRTVPTLAVVKVGAGGKIDLMANRGTLDLVADVVGYVTDEGASLHPVSPDRLLDTRFGIGAPTGRIGAGDEVAVSVTGSGGVPANATAVALNITAVKPTSNTFLTVYPGGSPRETTSSLNPDQGQVSANLVVSKIGSDGTVRIFNNRGDVDILADVTAYFL